MLVLEGSSPFSMCVLRHAEPVLMGSDRERALTEEGISQALQQKEALHPLFSADLVIASPAIRAEQTAEIVAQTTHIVVLDSLYEMLKVAESLLLKIMIEDSITDNKLINLKEEILAEIRACNASQVLIVAHSGVINLIGCLFAYDKRQVFLTRRFGICEGFLLVKP